MVFNETANTITAFTSAKTGATTAVDTVFYINLVLAFFALMCVTALIILTRKTSRASDAGLTAAGVLIIGLIAYVVQLIMYVYVNEYASYLVYAACSIQYAGFVTAAVYFFMLAAGNVRKALSIAAGATCFVPPVGAIIAVISSFAFRNDTRAQELVYDGYAYTYAALGAFCAKHGAKFIDGAENDRAENLSDKDIAALLKRLKKLAVTPEGKYEYAVAIARYLPQNIADAVSLLGKAANADYVPALFNLGYMFETGTYVKQNVKQARDYYARAAAGGDADAALRLGIVAVKEGKPDDGIRLFESRADGGDLFAKYDLAVCYELGIGVEKDFERAFDLYAELMRDGVFEAEERIFAIAADGINSAQNGEFFRNVTDRNYDGTFAVMIHGLIELKKRHAQDAADLFLQAVKLRGRWEGFARCLVGTLYLDSGKLTADKRNGAAYVRSAFGMTGIANEIYQTIPKKFI